MAKRSTISVTASSGNVFADIGVPQPEEALAKAQLASVPDAIAVKATMPPPLTPLVDGDIAFRQHDQGHTDAPNWSTFIEFAGHYFKSPGIKK